jgi:nucleotide-binding universal stress UspA family protein
MTYPDVTPGLSLPRAVDLAATIRGHLTALIHQVDIPPINNPVADFLLDLKKESDAAEQLSKRNGEELAKQLDLLCGRLGLPLVTERLKAERAWGDMVAERARGFDLTMLVCQPESPDHALLEQDVLFGSGGPVIVFPSIDSPAQIETVAIAWDGSRAAARAVRDALPLLKLAGKVQVLTCTQDKPISPTSIDAIFSLLSAHEIDAKEVPVGLNDQPVGDALQAGALAQDAGLLVMGAYGHSRVREFIMGGATTSVLNSPKLPLFMSH